MRRFGDLSLRRKLTLIIMLTSSVALLLACLVAVAYDWLNLRQTMENELASEAAVLGDDTTLALSSGDAAGAKNMLSVLRSQPHILAVFIFTRDGEPFAKYLRPDLAAGFEPLPRWEEGSHFEQGRLVNFRKITVDGETIGSIYLESDLGEMNDRLRRYCIILTLVVLLSSLVALFLGSRLQHAVSHPILELVHTTNRISSEKNYALRAASYGADELGLLVDGFNEMLSQIQGRDQELVRRRRDLEREVAARTAINSQLEAAKEAAEAASHVKGEFLANMSHEIRTPINGVMGMIELTLDTELTSDQRDCLSMAKSSAESLLGLINDILDFSKVESGRMDLEPIEFNVYDCVGETMKALALRAHQKGLELAYDVDPEMPAKLIGDPGRVRQILVNLVGNAIKFTEHGEVLVKIDFHSFNEEVVELHFKVTDTGIGIPPDKHDLLFKAFSQADSSTTRKYGGSGLGLAICARLVDLMGGKIWLESREGQGSTFHFTARMALPAAKSTPLAPLPEVDLQGVPVLVVDDNETNRRILSGLTLGWGMRPTAVESGAAALAAIAAAPRPEDAFRVILVDACMPGTDGFQLVEKIRERPGPDGSGSTILMLTSAGRPGEAALCQQLGVAAYLLKPVLKADLKAALLTVLGREAERPQIPRPLVTRHTLRESSRKYRILVAEDNAVNQAVVVRVLAKMGHASVVANNGMEALALISSQKFDLVFMDVQMPEMDGISATVAIRQMEKASRAHLPIFAMTAYAMSGDRERCLDAGMDGYIAKPVRFSDIENTLSALHGDGSAPAAPPPPDEPAAEHAPAIPRPVPWRKEEVLERLGEDDELMHELCDIFLNESPKLVGKLRLAIDQLDSGGVQRAAHSLKGEVSYLSAPAAAEAARLLENMGHEHDLARAPETLLLLEKELDYLRQAIQDWAGFRQ